MQGSASVHHPHSFSLMKGTYLLVLLDSDGTSSMLELESEELLAAEFLCKAHGCEEAGNSLLCAFSY